jgi:hypothetical protein
MAMPSAYRRIRRHPSPRTLAFPIFPLTAAPGRNEFLKTLIRFLDRPDP